MWRLRGSAVASIALFLCGGTSAATVEDFVEIAREVDIVIIGEVHDNPAHHVNQARIVAELQPAAIVMEMIPQEQEGIVNELRSEGAPAQAIEEALAWEESGWPPFAFYAPVLEAAPEARVFGAGQPVAEVNRAMVEGAAGPFGPDAAIYGLDQPLSEEEQSAREEMLAAAHCGKLPDEVLPGMVEAQRFRDAGLADAALWARTLTGGEQVVVITGNGHADRVRGIPAALAIADPEATVAVLGQLETVSDAEAAAAFDMVLVTEAPEREDPCAALPD
jgi:uncharacterized iron-regulated protein